MGTLHLAPGPVAEDAFTLGLVVSTTASLALVGLLFWADVLTPVGVVVALVAGVPVQLVAVSCLLGVWLGYADDALARVVAAASEE